MRQETEKAGAAAKSKSNFNVQPDMAGVLVMCARSKENRAVKEALDILQRVKYYIHISPRVM